MNNVLRFTSIIILLWLVFIAPPVTILALLNSLPFHAWWVVSLITTPLPLIVLVSALRSNYTAFRWWVFQYLGFSAVGFSAAAVGALLSLFTEEAVAGIVAAFGFFVLYAIALRAAHRIHNVPIEIASYKIVQPQRLVQISDVHIGSRQPAFLDKVIAQVNAQKPDILLITGDLLDENVSAESLQSLANLDYPVFYCSGNHERYVNYENVLANIASHGVSVLNDGMALINDIHILGIEDRQHTQEAREALNTLCAGYDSSHKSFRILLYHQPDLWPTAIDYGIDLTLSGHTHNGQIWPFGWLVRTRYKHIAGHYKSALSHLFVSQGTGTWGPILRLGTRCEMTIIELRPE